MHGASSFSPALRERMVFMSGGGGRHLTISGGLAIQRGLESGNFEAIERSRVSNALALQDLLLRPAALGPEG